MKTLKKLFTLLIAMVMTMGMSLTVFAEDTQGGTGTITVENATDKIGRYVADENGDLKKVDDEYVKIKANENYTGTKYKYVVDVNNDYYAYQIFQASPKNDGDDKDNPTTTWQATETNNHVSYTATPAQVSALSGKDVNALVASETGADGCFTFTKTANGNYVVGLGEGKTAKDVAKYFNANIGTLTAVTNAEVFPKTKLTVSSGKATATVPFGYYFVTSSKGSVVSVDTTNNNVHIVDKNTYGDPFNPGEDDNPSDDNLKNITEINGVRITSPDHDNTSAAIGDILTFEIKNNTSNFVVKNEGNPATPTSKKVSYVYVNDTIGAGLKYVEDNTHKLTVFVGGTELTESTGPIAAQDPAALKYYIKEQEESTNYTGDSFTVVIPWLDAAGNPVFADNAVVTVTYYAQLDELVDEVAGNAAGQNASNKADIKYDLVAPDEKPPVNPPTPDPGQGGENVGVKEDTVKVFVYAIAIQKYDGKDNSALSGAHFEITGPDGNIIVAKNTSDTEARYMFDSTKQKEYDESNPKTIPDGYTKDFVTNADGQIIIYGVKQGTYTATETVAPGGYNLMSGTSSIDASVSETKLTTMQIKITKYYVQADDGDYKKVAGVDGAPDTFVLITADDGDVAAANRYKETKEETDYSQPVQISTTTENVAYAAIENNKGTELPSTGGIGTTLFYTVGTILVLGAGILLFTKKRLDA